ncbi:MAG TPA: NAD(P)-dependent oxidoreductase [Candidatus Kapabacteria bacterium]|nr:NAD(P)-dependent oxidoreductase [Candidatus Kapabacteria bacterium]
MIKVLLVDTLSQKALELLGEIPEFEVEIKAGLDQDRLKTEIRDYEAVVVRSTILGKEILKEAVNLKIIVKAGIDLDNIDIEFARAGNIEVRNTPFATAITMAEYTLAQMLGICRFIGPAYRSMKTHHWERNLFANGSELHGKTAGIIGFGRIGKEVAKREIAMGMDVLFYDSMDIKTNIGARQVSLPELLSAADYISIHVPLTGSSRGLISFTEFERMKESVVLINTARSGVIDETALLDALTKNKIKAIAIDVQEKEFREKLEYIDNEKVFPTPYLGVSTVEGEERACVDVLAVLKEFFNV